MCGRRRSGRVEDDLDALRDRARDDDERRVEQAPEHPGDRRECDPDAVDDPARVGSPREQARRRWARRARRAGREQGGLRRDRPGSTASRAHSAVRNPRPQAPPTAGISSRKTISPAPPCAPRRSLPSTTTPAPRRSPRAVTRSRAHPTAAPQAPSANAASDASFSTWTIGAIDEKWPRSPRSCVPRTRPDAVARRCARPPARAPRCRWRRWRTGQPAVREASSTARPTRARRSEAESRAVSSARCVRTRPAAQVGDRDRDVRPAGIDADDGRGVRPQLEPSRRPPLLVFTGRAGVRAARG